MARDRAFLSEEDENGIQEGSRLQRRQKSYIIDNEITVTITLSEYRELVTTKAIKDNLVRAAEEDKLARNYENEALKKKNDELKSELYDLKKKLEGIGGESSEEDETNDDEPRAESD